MGLLGCWLDNFIYETEEISTKEGGFLENTKSIVHGKAFLADVGVVYALYCVCELTRLLHFDFSLHSHNHFLILSLIHFIVFFVIKSVSLVIQLFLLIEW